MKAVYFIIILSLFLSGYCIGQVPDSLIVSNDTLGLLKKDTLKVSGTDTLNKSKNDSIASLINSPRELTFDKLLKDNKYLNTQSKPVSFVSDLRNPVRMNGMFYLLAVLLLFFGILRTAYSRYYSTLFRVFFNTSLRQSQLSDQLLQSKLASMYFNLVFLFSAGFFIYLGLQKIVFGRAGINWFLLGLCIIILLATYLLKYILLQFLGWVTSNSDAVGTYIFIVFLINKIIGILLLPAIVIMAFSKPELTQSIFLIYLMIIGILLLLRYYRSYNLLQHKLGIGYFHFMIFVFAMEILPIILIYKAADTFIIKNL